MKNIGISFLQIIKNVSAWSLVALQLSQDSTQVANKALKTAAKNTLENRVRSDFFATQIKFVPLVDDWERGIIKVK